MNLECNQCGADLTYEDPDARYLIEADRYCHECQTVNPSKYVSREEDHHE